MGETEGYWRLCARGQGSDPLELTGVIIPGEVKIWGYFIVDWRLPSPPPPDELFSITVR